jgi:hypothetical protein
MEKYSKHHKIMYSNFGGSTVTVVKIWSLEWFCGPDWTIKFIFVRNGVMYIKNFGTWRKNHNFSVGNWILHLFNVAMDWKKDLWWHFYKTLNTYWIKIFKAFPANYSNQIMQKKIQYREFREISPFFSILIILEI